jgi:AmmeMemoRadiSam system protein A
VAPPPASLTSQERNFLLQLARKTLQQVVTTGRMPTPDPYDFPDNLREKKGCFVTLKKNGQLRGCIGYIFPLEPLYKAVMDNACAAALKDRRFDPVQPEELEAIEIEISVLTVPQPLAFDSPTELLTRLRPNVDGVVLRIGGRQSTYLPQVWEQLPDKERFLSYLSAKAGCPPLAWKEPGTSVLTYQAEAFKESGM